MTRVPFPFDAVLFDLDGTLVATEDYWVPAARRAAARVLAELGVERAVPTASEWMSIVGLPFDRGLGVLFPELDGAGLERVRAACDQEEEQTLASEGARLLPGVHETLTSLRDEGVRLGIASNCGRGYLERVTAALGLESRVDELRCLDSPGIDSKADMIADLLLTFDTRSAVMVGDRHVDGEAARANGVPFLHVPSGYGAVDEGAGALRVLGDVGELVGALRARTAGLERLARELGLGAAGIASVGVTGRRASGKSLFARDLAGVVRAGGREARVVELESFRTAADPDDRDPLRTGFDLERVLDAATPANGELVVLEGPFLLEPRIATRLSRLVYVDVPAELALERIAGRDGRLAGAAPVAEARTRDLPTEEAFEARFAPARADAVVRGGVLLDDPRAPRG